MKFINKDINNTKSEIKKERMSEINFATIASTIVLVILGFDFIKDRAIFETTYSFFYSKFTFYIFTTMILISFVSDIIRFIFMKLGKNFYYLNENVYFIVMSTSLTLNLVVTLVKGEFNIIFFIVTVVCLGISFYHLYKEIKNN